jgi:hypothetical protein
MITMIRRVVSVLILLGCTLLFSTPPVVAQVNTSKPWTYWWWMGGIATENDLRESLQELHRAGIGGLHIIPIYGVKGYESEFQPMLGDKWMESFAIILSEAKKLNLGVDMTTGAGWPFGGPHIRREEGVKRWVFKDGHFEGETTGQEVERAGPGGIGYVIDPFDVRVMEKYLARFDSAFLGKDVSYLRSLYCDSYEVDGANWTERFSEEFRKRRGYDFESVATLFLDTIDTPASRLVKIDYQQTLSELLYESSAYWTRWSEERNLQTRYQAHGSPANLLDLYSLSSIPETESFGSSKFPIPLLEEDKDYSIKSFGRPDPLIMKFASSATGVRGKRLISAETATWLANHFKVSLTQVKPQLDELFTAGINHVFFHGTTFSPQRIKFPGWLYYASTNFGPSSHFYKEFPLMNSYIANCQSVLQNSEPDNDVLVYFPIQDIWANDATAKWNVHPLGVHKLERWFNDTPFANVCKQLKQSGYSFDYISDLQLRDVKVVNKKIKTVAATYKVLVVPQCSYLSQTTLDRLAELGKQGAVIIFDERLPENVTGYLNHSTNRVLFEKTKEQLRADKQHFIVPANLDSELKKQGVSQEALMSLGLSFIRKKQKGKSVYFISNLGNTFTKGWVELGSGSIRNYSGYEALSGQKYGFVVRKKGNKQELYLSLLPGQSCFIFEEESNYRAKDIRTYPGEYAYFPVKGNWDLQFLNGRPDYHQSFRLSEPQSWTGLSDTAAIFSGTASYKITVNVPEVVAGSKDVFLDLGNVRESAVVKLNGQRLGTVWCIPFQLAIPSGILKKGENKLEIEVTNLSANYMRWYDPQHPEWRRFYDINMVDITYKQFNAASWDLAPSGLISDNVKIGYR